MDEKHILESWKEIADYLGRTIRTCQRWEQEFGLPIHRLGHSLKASVFAYKEEVDRWQEKALHHLDKAPEKVRLNPFLQKSIMALVLAVFLAGLVFFVLKPLLHKWSAAPGVPAAAKTASPSAAPDAAALSRAIGRTGPISTSSWEAHKNLLEAMVYFDRGEYRPAISLFQKALSLDSKFAMAYLGMGWSLQFLGYRTECAKYFQRAFDLRTEISQRERLRVEGHFYARTERTFPSAFEALNELHARYPDDYSGNLTAERLLIRIEEFEKAEALCLKGLQTGILNSRTFFNLVWCYQTKGLCQEAERLFQTYLAQDPANTLMRGDYARHLLIRSRLNPALDEINKAILLNPMVLENHIIKGDINLCRNDFGAARREYHRLSKLGEPSGILWQEMRLATLSLAEGKIREFRSHISEGTKLARSLGESLWERDFLLLLADVNLRFGNPDGTLEILNQVWINALAGGALDVQRRILHRQGILNLTLGRQQNAQDSASELAHLIQEGMNKRAMKYYFHLVGLMRMEEGKMEEALESLGEAVGLLFPAHFGSDSDDAALLTASLAFANLEQGLLDKAEKEYESISRMTVGRIPYGDLHAKSFYMLGRAAEQAGNKGKAKARYEEFLGLWRDADPGIPEVEDARKRLAGL